MADAWTTRRMLQWMAEDLRGRGVPSARLDAELLLADALGCGRVQLYLDLDRPLSPDELQAVRQRVKRRRALEPVAYILGEREFVGRTFEVGPGVLIPRPDTETLVEQALAGLPVGQGARVLDLCTGSGCIAVTLAAERPELQVTATDVSDVAAAVATRNAERHGVSDRLQVWVGDLWAALAPQPPFDLVVSNPPYVTEAEWGSLAPDVRDHEPRLALVGGDDGLAFYRRLAAAMSTHLAPGGRTLLEVGAGQAHAVGELLRQAGMEVSAYHRDLGGIERVVDARSPA